MDTEDLSFAEGILAMRGFIPEEAEPPGLSTHVTSEKLCCKNPQHCSTRCQSAPFLYTMFVRSSSATNRRYCAGLEKKKLKDRTQKDIHLLLMPLELELATEPRLDRPLSLAELVSFGDVCDGESRPRSNLTAESGLSGSGLLRLALALFLAALLRNERREFSICGKHTKWHVSTERRRTFNPLDQQTVLIEDQTQNTRSFIYADSARVPCLQAVSF